MGLNICLNKDIYNYVYNLHKHKIKIDAKDMKEISDILHTCDEKIGKVILEYLLDMDYINLDYYSKLRLTYFKSFDETRDLANDMLNRISNGQYTQDCT